MDEVGKNLIVQERIVTVKGLGYMRQPSLDPSGKQVRDGLGPPDERPSNGQNLRFPCPEILGAELISVEEYYKKSMLRPSKYKEILKTSQDMGTKSSMQKRDTMLSIVVRTVKIPGKESSV